MRLHIAVLACLSMAPVVSTSAQVAAPVAVGSRVRVTLPEPGERRFGVRPPERWLVGEVVAFTSDTLVVRPHPLLEPISIPRTALQRLDSSRGAPSRWQSAALGAVVGAVLGVGWGQTLYDLDLRNDRFRSAPRARSWGAAYGAISFAFIGALFPTERWRRVSLD